MKRMKYSILIPVYNTEKYLAECVKSVLNQSISDFEIILANDGSTDGSAAICDELALLDNRIRVFHKKNERLMMTRRFEINKAKGDWILFLDSDDYWKADLLEYVDAAIKKYNPDMVIYNYNRVSEYKTEKNPGVFDNETLFDDSNRETFLHKAIGQNRVNSMWIKAVKREVVLADKTQYDRYQPVIVSGEDIFQSIPLFFISKKIVYLDEALINYRELPQSITTTFNRKKFAVIEEEYKRKEQYLREYGYWNDVFCSEMSYTAVKKASHLLFVNVTNAKISFSEKIKLMKDYRNNAFICNCIRNMEYVSKHGAESIFTDLWIKKYNYIALLLSTFFQKTKRLRRSI